MSASSPVTIVVPTLNGGSRLRELLDAVGRQDVEYRIPMVAIDSGSTDGTVDALRRFGAQVLQTGRTPFNHGESRNAALRAVATPLAVLMVQDAVPASPGWLRALVAPLESDPSIAGTFGRQQPWPDASRLTVHYLSTWAAALDTPRVSGPLPPAVLDAMSPADRHAACVFDNVCSCVRIRVWQAHPFARTPIAEDLEWARDVLRAGHRLAFVPEAVVWHSHERGLAYELRRTYLVHQRLHALFGLATIPSAGALIRSVASTIPLHLRLAAGEPTRRVSAIARAAGLALALPVGQYLGALSSRTGRGVLPQGGA